MTRRLFRTAAPAVVCGLGLLLAGCGGGRAYALPKDLCGVPVDQDALSPLLQDGEKLDVVGDPLATSTSICAVSVDHYPAVSIQADRTDKFYDPMAELESFRFTNRKEMPTPPFDAAGAVGDRSVMITARCEAPAARYAVVNFTFGDRAEEDVDRRRADMEAFALAFVPSVKKELACTA
ncbi:hypothetical protein [[Kitasatospora] papulosa]|uniref:hypothetical protein n=1 Tax=[Kitasatospora] papulosa TaxID=1464011 RepID=UPI00368B687D